MQDADPRRARLFLLLGLATLAALALAPRLWRLGAADLGQAEHQKLDALAAWHAGDLIVDGEHPALLKGLAFLLAEAIGPGPVALRLPSAVAGAVSALLVAMIGRRLAGPVAGWAAGALAALGTLAVGIDRVGKEDALMVALALGAVLAWLASDGRPRRWLLVAGLAGAAAAAKYEALPLLPLILLAGRLGLGPRAPRLRTRVGAGALGVAAAVHVALNPFVLAPAQWGFVADFVAHLGAGEPPPDGTIVPTTGFAAAGDLHDHKPVWYYALVLGLRSQPLWIALALVGVALALRRRGPGDRLLLVWAVAPVAVLSLVPFGYARYLAPALPALALLGGVAAARAWEALPRAARAPAAAVGLSALALPLAGVLPYPTLYVNRFGGGSDRALHWAPDDAVGNLGITRAVAAVRAWGVDGAVAVVDPVLLRRLSAGALHPLAVEGLPPSPDALRSRGVRAVIVQPSQLSLGNAPLVRWLAGQARPSLVVHVRGLEVVRVYRVGADGEPTPALDAGSPVTARR